MNLVIHLPPSRSPGAREEARTEIHLAEIPAGRFLMGSTSGLPHAPEDPVHEVTIQKSFLLSVFPATQGLFQQVMGTNPSAFTGDPDLPVENVTWIDAKNFCQSLGECLQRLVRLPSEAEWEYAYRAGTETGYWFGEDPAALPLHAWFEENSGEKTHPAGLKLPNPWGLHDMAGNLWEWCEDTWHGSYVDAPSDGTAWTADLERQPRRCVRGGAWDMNAFRCRASYRSFDWKDNATNRLGFRFVVETG